MGWSFLLLVSGLALSACGEEARLFQYYAPCKIGEQVSMPVSTDERLCPLDH